MPRATFHKTRLAPTPSGFLHVGNAYSFALTAALAQKTGASILLRIDDMDRDRVQPEYVTDVFDTLHFLDIPWHEGPKDAADFEAHFSQRHRLPLYEKALERLVATGLVYACDCSRKQINEQYGGVYPGTCKHKEIPLSTKDVSWRIDTDKAQPIRVKQLHDEQVFTALPADVQHFIVRKKDGFPAYQLTSLVDDLHFGIDLIVRGEDLFSSTLAQLFLADMLKEDKFLDVTFYHHGLLKDGARKLSKSAGDTSIKYLLEEGKAANEIFALIGEKVGLQLTGLEDFQQLL